MADVSTDHSALGPATDASPSRRVALVVNPKSREAADYAEVLREALAEGGVIPIEPNETEEPDRRFAEIEALCEDVDMVVAAGGDGTLHYLAQVLAGTEVPLAVIPLGTANDFARSVGLPLELDAAIDVALRGRPAPVDVAVANGRVFLNAASIGMVEQVTHFLSPALKAGLGPLAYVHAAAQAYFEAHPFRVTLEIDGKTQQLEALQVTVGNGRYFGPSIEVAPEAEVDSGSLHVCAIEAVNPFRLAVIATKLLRGHHDRAEGLDLMEGHTIEISTPEPMDVFADGERICRTPVQIDVAPRRLWVMVPEGS